MLYDGYLDHIQSQKREIELSMQELDLEEEFAELLESRQLLPVLLKHHNRKPEITALLSLTPKQRLAKLRKKYTDSQWVELNVLAFAALCMSYHLLSLINEHTPAPRCPYRDMAISCFVSGLALGEQLIQKLELTDTY